MGLCRLLRTVALPLIFGLAPVSLFAQTSPENAIKLAQTQATMVSDTLDVEGRNRLIATGHVEMFHQGQRLTAERVTYDRAKDQLLIEGPMTLIDRDGRQLVLASQAELSGDFENGILLSARMVLEQQLQIAARNMTRIEGRYTSMNEVVASACQVCAARPTPIWDIRAKRVVHDAETRMIYFDHARVRMLGVPVAYLPHLRVPDPSVERASGFLAPSLRSTSQLGTGVKLPYFIALERDRDLTLTPYLSSENSQTLEFHYRHAFNRGAVEVLGAVTSDNLTADSRRGWLRARAGFQFDDNVLLTFDLQTSSDNAYLLDYGYSDADRLDSRIELSQVQRMRYLSGRVVSFQSLRDSDDNDKIPSLHIDGTYHQRFALGVIGGMGGVQLQSASAYRTSSSSADSDADGISDGRDMSRLSLRLDWRRSLVSQNGLVTTLLGEAQLDSYHYRQDARLDSDYTRSYGAAGVELRWPLVKSGALTGASHVIEPVLQVIAATGDDSGIPNEDSILTEFDEGNIWSLDRFPGNDAVERASRVNMGVSWTRYSPAGWNSTLTLGKVFRQSPDPSFSHSSGLSGQNSDWLVAAQVDMGNGFAATARALFKDDLEVNKAEMRLNYNQPRYGLNATLWWMQADPQESRNIAVHEITFGGHYRFTDHWTAHLNTRYDFEVRDSTLAEIGLNYTNECVRFGFAASRRSTWSDSVDPTTVFDLSLELLGFGRTGGPGPLGRCS